MKTDKERDFAWAAGLFEGEGSVMNGKARDGRRMSLRMSLGMADQDVVARFHQIVGCGTLCGVKAYRDGWKGRFVWTLSTRAQIVRLIRAFWPYLGERRRRRAFEVVYLSIASKPLRLPQICPVCCELFAPKQAKQVCCSQPCSTRMYASNGGSYAGRNFKKKGSPGHG